MKRLIAGALGASMLLTCGVLTSTAQAAPDLDVTCAQTYAVEGDGYNDRIVAGDCAGATAGSWGRGLVTLQDRSEKFWCKFIEVDTSSGLVSVRARGCSLVDPN